MTYICALCACGLGEVGRLHQRHQEEARHYASCQGRAGTKMNLGSVETFSGLDHMVVAMLTVIMVLYGGECMRGDMCDEGCSL